MPHQTVFKRYELKYLLTQEQQKRLLAVMHPYMKLDKYGRTTIRNLYLDTDSYLLIRRSIEKPTYKEKLRIRSYATVDTDGEVFVELKKKYDSVVYKRRISLAEREAMLWTGGDIPCPKDTQISREIDYFRSFYEKVYPRVFLSYEREAFFERSGGDFRITFDNNILCRDYDLTLTKEAYGTPILDEGLVLMEIKCSGGIPLWLTDFLSSERIYKTSFSKYGTAYRELIFPKLHNHNNKEATSNGKAFSRTL